MAHVAVFGVSDDEVCGLIFAGADFGEFAVEGFHGAIKWCIGF